MKRLSLILALTVLLAGCTAGPAPDPETPTPRVVERTVTVPSPTPEVVERTVVVTRTVVVNRTVTVIQPSPTPRVVTKTVVVTKTPTPTPTATPTPDWEDRLTEHHSQSGERVIVGFSKETDDGPALRVRYALTYWTEENDRVREWVGNETMVVRYDEPTTRAYWVNVSRGDHIAGVIVDVESVEPVG